MKEKTMNKKELLAALAEIEKKEREQMLENYYPEFKKLEGRFFKKQNNYSCPEKKSDYWWLYTKVVSVKPQDVYLSGSGVASHFSGWTFQTCKYKNVTIEKNAKGYVQNLGDEITEKEFNKAWNDMLLSLAKLP